MKRLSVKFEWMRMAFIVLAVLLPLGSCEWFEDCDTETDDLLYDPYIAAMQYPEDFETYMADNPDKFSGKFDSCCTQVLDRQWDAYYDAQDECDDLYLEGSDWWNDCYDEADSDYGGVINLLDAMQRLANGEITYEESYISVIAGIKDMDPDSYNYAISAALSVPGAEESLRSTLECREENCENFWEKGCMITTLFH